MYDQCIWSGRGSSWILQTFNTRYRAWEGVTMETVAM